MNCREIRSLFEEQSDANSTSYPEYGVAEHLANCFACAEWVQSREELAASLRMTREAVPEISPSLDHAVLANYRRYTAETAVPERATRGRKFNPFTALAWGAALALAILVAAAELGLVLPRNEGGVWTDQKRAPAEIATTAAPADHPVASTVHASSSSARQARNKPRIAQEVRRPRDLLAAKTTASGSELAESMPEGFRGLMYCDALSCGGPMEVIRLQLPLQQVLPAPGMGANSVVSADVLVGPDGIARGIRIVE